MTSKYSAGLLMCRSAEAEIEMLLAHPGGPIFAGRDAGVWTLPKGLVEPGEDALEAAIREFQEETGFAAAVDGYESLGEVVQKGGKRVVAWAFWGDCDPTTLRSNTFEMEWPPKSGRIATFPEVDRAAFFTGDEARRRILPTQEPFIARALAWCLRG